MRTTLVFLAIASAALALSTSASASPGTSARPSNSSSLEDRFASGTLMRVAGTSQVYVVAGGAPLPIEYSEPASDSRVVEVSQKTIDRLRAFPTDGTFLRVVENGVTYRIAGGAPFRIYHFTPIEGWESHVNVNQTTIDRLPAFPTDGTFLRAAETGKTYRVAGGSPLPIDDCAPLGGCPDAVEINQYAIDLFDHLQAAPATGTLLRAAETGYVYKVADGIPSRIYHFKVIAGCRKPVTVNQKNIDRLLAFPANGVFLRSADTGQMYRIAGDAPLPIEDCAPLGGCRGAVTVSRKAIDRLRTLPTDGTFLRAVETHVIYRVAGGAPLRIIRYTPVKGWRTYTDVAQKTIDRLRAFPTDGTFLRAAETDRIYRVAGGAPLPIEACKPLGGCPDAVEINKYAIDRLDHLRAAPATGTFLRAVETDVVYRIAGWNTALVAKCPSARCRDAIDVTQLAVEGAFLRAAGTGRTYRIVQGALLPITSCKPFAGCPGVVEVARSYISRLARRHTLPAEGTFLRSVETGKTFRVAGGSPLPINDCQPLGGCPNAVEISQYAIDRLDHLRAAPANGTFLNAAETGFVYRIAGGAPFPVTDFKDIGDSYRSIKVNQDTIDHLRTSPKDGTLLRGVETGNTYRVSGGSPVLVSSCARRLGCAAAVGVNQRSISRLAQLKADRSSTDTSKSLSLLLLGLLIVPIFYVAFTKPGAVGSRSKTVLHRVLAGTPFEGGDRDRLLVPLLLGAVAFLPPAVAQVRSSTRLDFSGSELASFARVLLVVYVLTLLVLAVLSVGSDRSSVDARLLAVLLLAYWLIGALADVHEGNSYKRLSYFSVPLIIAAAIALRPRYERAVAVLAWGSIAICAASLLLALLRSGAAYTVPARTTSFLFQNRMAGVLDHANSLGVFSGLGVVLTFTSKGIKRLIGLPICAFALFASDSRVAWVATCAAISLLVATSIVSRRSSSGVVVRQLLAAGSATALFTAGLGSYLILSGDPHSSDLNERTAIWHFVLQKWNESPIIGHGPGIWRTLTDEGVLPYWAGQGHDQFFETLMTTGIAGLVLLVAILVVWSRASIRAAKKGHWLPLALELFVVLLGTLLSPVNPWGANGGLWLLSIVLFLDPVTDSDGARKSASARVRGRNPTPRTVAGAER